MEINRIYHDDCINFMINMAKDSVDLTLTDIPYEGVNKSDNGLRTISKGMANDISFDLDKFLE